MDYSQQTASPSLERIKAMSIVLHGGKSPAIVIIVCFGLAVLPRLSAQSSKPAVKAIDYIVEHLKKSGRQRLPDDLFGDRFYRPIAVKYSYLSMNKIEKISDCELELAFSRVVISEIGGGALIMAITLRLKDAEAGGVKADDAKVVLRMRQDAPVKITVGATTLDKGDDSKLPILERYETLGKVPIPAEDAETAQRLGRAFEHQIRACGGKPDPFAH